MDHCELARKDQEKIGEHSIFALRALAQPDCGIWPRSFLRSNLRCTR
jgi:hypothetical protein